jgi:hypothetical protein
MIGRRITLELNRVDALPTLQGSLGDTVHSVHDGAVRREDYREGQVGLVDQSDVLEHRTPRGAFVLSEPDFVEVTDSFQRDELAGKMARQLNQVVYIPGKDALV